MSEQTKFRCAIYTRKSSEEGLDQDFNSIEAQREAGEAYVRSQAHEGWTLIGERFDDGGYSGGSMDRPGLERLLHAVRAGEVDVIVIYKIDRLTRSLTDFARLAETFDQHKVSFVSVTQQFNTTNSMGRLMLNVLLSFAQFEREITGERIRDKIAASKKKGMWMGGMVPMGYATQDRRLLIEEREAETVRKIFERYLEAGSVPVLIERLKAEGMTTPARLSAKGNVTGSRQFTRGHLYKLLSNPIYIGRVQHKAVSHRGQHTAIIDMALWAAVQSQLAANTQGPRQRRRRAATESYLLTDLLVGSDGGRFTPTHANKGSRRYRYYVEDAPTAPRRLPAVGIERAVLAGLGSYLRDHHQLAHDLEIASASGFPLLERANTIADQLDRNVDEKVHSLIRTLLLRVVYREARLEICLTRNSLRSVLGCRDTPEDNSSGNIQDSDDAIIVRRPVSLRRRGRQLKLVMDPPDGGTAAPDRTLITAVARARDWAARIVDDGASQSEIAAEEQVTDGYVSQLLPLAYLAPSIVEDIIAGRQSPALTADGLIWRAKLPLAWSGQIAKLAAQS
jgi:DNA invertase Pin-like site-specific DNA recombinase